MNNSKTFLEELKINAKANKKTIILPEWNDERIIEAAVIVLKEELANLIIIGKKEEIIASLEEKSKKYQIEYSIELEKNTLKIIDMDTYSKKEQLIKNLYNLRREKGMTLEEASNLIKDNIYFGMMYLKEIEGDGLVAGATKATKDILRPALQLIKKKADVELVSTFFIMELNREVESIKNKLSDTEYIFSDCGLNQNPTAEELAAIAKESEESYLKIISNISKKQPKIAMLSYSTYNSATSKEVEKVKKATEILKLAKNNVDGELQLDAAISKEIAAKKSPNSNIEGAANVLIFPNIEAGNIGYKLVQNFAKANAYGPICQGLNKPVNDLSRGSTITDIVGVILITCMQS